MHYRAMLRLAFDGLARQKVRTGLTLFGISIGSCAMIFSLALGFGLQGFIEHEFRRRTAFWAVNVHPAADNPVPESEIPEKEIAIVGEMSDERRQRLRKIRVERYQQMNSSDRKLKLTDDVLTEMQSIPDVQHVEAWHRGHGSLVISKDRRRQSGQVISGPYESTSLAKRLVAGRMPDPHKPEMLLSEFLLYDLGFTDEKAVEELFNKPISLDLGGANKSYTLAYMFGIPALEMTEDLSELLERVLKQLPKSIENLDLTQAEKGKLALVLKLANSEMRTPAKKGESKPAIASFQLVGVVRDLSRAEYQDYESGDSWEIKQGEIFLAQDAGRALFNQLRGESDGYYSAVLRVRPGGDLRRVVESVEKMGYGQFSLLKIYDTVKIQIYYTALGLNAFALITLFVASLGMVNTLVTSVIERTREIGILKAVGASNRQVRRLFLVEAAILGIVGGLVGIAIAFGVSYPLEGFIRRMIEQSSMEKLEVPRLLQFPLWLLASTLTFAVTITTLAALYPAHRAARIQPVEALRAS